MELSINCPAPDPNLHQLKFFKMLSRVQNESSKLLCFSNAFDKHQDNTAKEVQDDILLFSFTVNNIGQVHDTVAENADYLRF